MTRTEIRRRLLNYVKYIDALEDNICYNPQISVSIYHSIKNNVRRQVHRVVSQRGEGKISDFFRYEY